MYLPIISNPQKFLQNFLSYEIFLVELSHVFMKTRISKFLENSEKWYVVRKINKFISYGNKNLWPINLRKTFVFIIFSYYFDEKLMFVASYISLIFLDVYPIGKYLKFPLSLFLAGPVCWKYS